MTNDVIHLLPDSVANQIAAGEVIQRPASVVKELVENSIDAGATSVQIVVKDAGRTLIQVIDNGSGMTVTDARMAFERHATSKIRQATDLFSLCTMGFRGEALPSIAAVSEIEMKTMPQGETTGTRLCISASKVESQGPDICKPGTNIMVKRLFFNLPARRKFLKKDPIELGHITKEFERLALVNTSVEFTLVHNDVTLHKLQAAPLKQRITDLFGKSLDHQLIPVSTSTSLADIEGFVSLPQHARRRGAMQFFFVNGRYMRHPYFHKAVLGCYDQLISTDTQPSYFINFKVAPETIDVNIHPQKYEIKFENEQPLWQILQASIKEALGRFNASSAIDFNTIDAPDIPAYQPEDISMPPMSENPDYNPFKVEHSQPSYQRAYVPTDWDKLYAGFTAERSTQKASTSHSSPIPQAPTYKEYPTEDPTSVIEAEAEAPSMFQLKGRYIVCSSKSGLMIIDQHRAHQRILFEQFIQGGQDGIIGSQRLIFPETLTLSTAQHVVASSIKDMLTEIGFELQLSSEGVCTIYSVPTVLGKASTVESFVSVLDAVAEEDADIKHSQWHNIANTMAKSAAVKYGTKLTTIEMQTLVSGLLKLSTPNYTPDGKPILHIIEIDDLQNIMK